MFIYWQTTMERVQLKRAELPKSGALFRHPSTQMFHTERNLNLITKKYGKLFWVVPSKEFPLIYSPSVLETKNLH